MIKKEHLTIEGFRDIFSIKASLGKGLSEKLINVFPDLTPKEKHVFTITSINDDNWLAGFSSAEGCFYCRVKKSSSVKIGYQVTVAFIIIQHSRDISLLNVMKDQFECGVVRKDIKKPYATWTVSNLSEIINIIIPFFDKFSIEGSKNLDYQDFRKIVFLMKDKLHLTDNGLKEIMKIKARMNRNRESDTVKD